MSKITELQAICLAHGESIVDGSEKYKNTSDALKSISNAWSKADQGSKDAIVSNILF